jgi:hypothetical protein
LRSTSSPASLISRCVLRHFHARDVSEIHAPPAPPPTAVDTRVLTRLPHIRLGPYQPDDGDSGGRSISPSVVMRSAIPPGNFPSGMAMDSRRPDPTFLDYRIGGWPGMRR